MAICTMSLKKVFHLYTERKLAFLNHGIFILKKTSIQSGNESCVW